MGIRPLTCYVSDEYFHRLRKGQIWMLTLYPKNVAENIPAHVLKGIRDEIDG